MREEREIPKYKRKKGKKIHRIESRLTPEGAQRRRDKEEEKIQKEMEWSDGYTKYEHLKHAEQALMDIEKTKKRVSRNCNWWDARLKDYEHRIKEV